MHIGVIACGLLIFLHAVCFKFIDIFANVKLVFGYGQAEQLWILGPTGI
jgi:hypothetical protein